MHSAHFTPPPWHVEAGRPHFAVLAGRDLVAARIASRDDAQLIEASPDLFDAADAALDWLQLISPTNPVTQRLAAALDKATVH